MDLENKKVLVRVEFNVPIKNGMVVDDTRIRATIPTLNYLLEKHCKIILMSKLGRPEELFEKGMKLEEVKKKLTYKPVADDLSDILGMEVGFVEDCINVEIPEDKDIVMLENLRFHKEELTNNKTFAKKLSEHGEIFVNDAFGNCHREHASVSAITEFLPSCAGFLVEKEVRQLSKLLKPERPFVAIVAGAKADKIGALKVMSKKADKILIGGVLANTFLKANGIDIGASTFDQETFNIAKNLIKSAGKKLVLPSDVIVADNFDNKANIKTVNVEKIPKAWLALDIGTKTVDNYKKELKNAKTILWAGPLGVFEMKKFSNGTKQIGNFLSKLKATVIVGGGDTVAVIQSLDLADKMTHVSTGGGASLEFIEKEGKLPALVALEKAYLRSKEE